MVKDPWWNNLPSSGYRVCSTCQQPYPGDTKGCRNPACPSNPGLSTEGRKKLVAAQKKRDDEKADREKLARARSRAAEFGRR